MADYTPIFTGGVQPYTQTASGTITGGRVVAVSATGTVAHAAADSLVAVGVAGHDAASGANVTVWPIVGCIHELEASGAITAAAGVVTDANGQVKTATIATAAAAGSLIGTALTTAAGSPLKLRVLGRN
ncbi:MAG TPA: capsid cement protein [Micromonosporaceae bacterium]